MDSTEVSNEQIGMRLRSAFLQWGACLVVLGLLIYLGSSTDSSMFSNLAFFFYFGAGVYLNRVVLRRIVEWHPVYNTLYNVTSDKLKFFFLWPVTYFFLFVRLGINKVL